MCYYTFSVKKNLKYLKFPVGRNGKTNGGGVGVADTHFLVSEPQEGRTYLSEIDTLTHTQQINTQTRTHTHTYTHTHRQAHTHTGTNTQSILDFK